MPFLAAILRGMLGKQLATITIPLLAVGIVTLGHQAWKMRDARLLAKGEAVCRAEWADDVRKEEREAAARQVQAAERVLETERTTSEGLRDELTKLTAEMDSIRRAGAGSDGQLRTAGGNCLSDGVLDALRKRQQSGQPKGGGARRLQGS